MQSPFVSSDNSPTESEVQLRREAEELDQTIRGTYVEMPPEHLKMVREIKKNPAYMIKNVAVPRRGSPKEVKLPVPTWYGACAGPSPMQTDDKSPTGDALPVVPQPLDSEPLDPIEKETPAEEETTTAPPSLETQEPPPSQETQPLESDGYTPVSSGNRTPVGNPNVLTGDNAGVFGGTPTPRTNANRHAAQREKRKLFSESSNESNTSGGSLGFGKTPSPFDSPKVKYSKTDGAAMCTSPARRVLFAQPEEYEPKQTGGRLGFQTPPRFAAINNKKSNWAPWASALTPRQYGQVHAESAYGQGLAPRVTPQAISIEEFNARLVAQLAASSSSSSSGARLRRVPAWHRSAPSSDFSDDEGAEDSHPDSVG